MSEITKDQLDLLMGSYKDSIELNTTLLGKLDNVLTSQKESCVKVDKLCDKIDQQTTTLTDSNLQIGEKLVNIRMDSLKEHNSIKHRIYVGYSMMGTILSGLITAIVKLFMQ